MLIISTLCMLYVVKTVLSHFWFMREYSKVQVINSTICMLIVLFNLVAG